MCVSFYGKNQTDFLAHPKHGKNYKILMKVSKDVLNARWGKNRFTVVSTEKSLFLYYYLLIIVLFPILTTVTLLSPTQYTETVFYGV